MQCWLSYIFLDGTKNVYDSQQFFDRRDRPINFLEWGQRSGGKLVPQSFIQNLPKILLETAGSNFVFIFQVDLYFSIKFATPSSS